MRFMMLIFPIGYENEEPGTMPDLEGVERMMVYNRSLQDAGVLITLEGLHPPSMGARISFAAGKPVAMKGPFPAGHVPLSQTTAKGVMMGSRLAR